MTARTTVTIAGHAIREPLQFLRKEHLNGLHLRRAQDNDELIERIWTVNNEKRMLKLFSQNVDGIFTDDFEKAMATREQMLCGFTLKRVIIRRFLTE